MTPEIPIPGSAIEAAQDSYLTSTGRVTDGAMEAAIRAFLHTMGVTVETRAFVEWKDGTEQELPAQTPARMQELLEGPSAANRGENRQRLVSEWRPVNAS